MAKRNAGSGSTAGGRKGTKVQASPVQGDVGSMAGGGSGCERPETSNTGLSTSQTDSSPSSVSSEVFQGDLNSVQFSGSEDTVEASLYVDWPGEDPKACAGYDWCMKFREAAKVLGKAVAVDLGKNSVMVKGYGKTGAAVQYHAVLQHMGITFFLSFSKHEISRPNVAIAAGSLVCMTLGPDGVRREVKKIIGLLGGIVTRGTWKRYDLCIDLAGLPVHVLVAAYQSGLYISRAKDGTVHHEDVGSVHYRARKVTGFSHGKGIILRVYDKVLEANTKGDKEKLAFLEANRFKGCSECTRVEVQFRGEHLREFGLADWDDWGKMREKMTEWAVNNWFRMANCVDRTHTSRADVLPVWALVQRAFSQVYGSGSGRPKRVKPHGANMRKLILQGLGVFASIAAMMAGDEGQVPTMSEVIAMAETQRNTPWVDAVQYKQVERGHRILPWASPIELDDLDLS